MDCCLQFNISEVQNKRIFMSIDLMPVGLSGTFKCLKTLVLDPLFSIHAKLATHLFCHPKSELGDSSQVKVIINFQNTYHTGNAFLVSIVTVKK